MFEVDMKPTPKNQLKFWVKTTKHFIKLAKKNKNIYILKYDDLCKFKSQDSFLFLGGINI